MRKFTWFGLFGRLFAAAILVFGAYNPWYSLYHWSMDGAFDSIKLLVVAGWTVALVAFFIATYKSLGLLGSSALIAFLGVAIFAAIDHRLFAINGSDFVVVLANLALTVLLGVGAYGSVIWRSFSGQADVDDVSD